MRAIDFSHKITSRKVIFAKIKKKFFSEVLLQSLPPPLTQLVSASLHRKPAMKYCKLFLD
jgi:hypothetical protein